MGAPPTFWLRFFQDVCRQTLRSGSPSTGPQYVSSSREIDQGPSKGKGSRVRPCHRPCGRYLATRILPPRTLDGTCDRVTLTATPPLSADSARYPPASHMSKVVHWRLDTGKPSFLLWSQGRGNDTTWKGCKAPPLPGICCVVCMPKPG